MKNETPGKWTDWCHVGKEEIEHYKETAEKIFMPVYKILAREVIDEFGIKKGTGIDIGSGTGGFACEIAKISELKLFALDTKKEMIEIMKEKIEKEGLVDRVIPEYGNAHDLPFDDNSVDLIVSRGSFQFWSDKRMVISEIFRVLKLGGFGFVGGGFGKNKEIRERAMKLHKKTYKKINNGRSFAENLKMKYQEYREILKEFTNYKINFDKSGLWIIVRK